VTDVLGLAEPTLNVAANVLVLMAAVERVGRALQPVSAADREKTLAESFFREELAVLFSVKEIRRRLAPEELEELRVRLLDAYVKSATALLDGFGDQGRMLMLRRRIDRQTPAVEGNSPKRARALLAWFNDMAGESSVRAVLSKPTFALEHLAPRIVKRRK
jgi:hypothetical protein